MIVSVLATDAISSKLMSAWYLDLTHDVMTGTHFHIYYPFAQWNNRVPSTNYQKILSIIVSLLLACVYHWTNCGITGEMRQNKTLGWLHEWTFLPRSTRMLFWCLFPPCLITREMNTNINLSSVQKRCAYPVHTLFSMYHKRRTMVFVIITSNDRSTHVWLQDIT